MKARALGGDSPCETKETTSSAAFAMVFLTPLRAAGLKAEVFVWDDFHDRYLISNLVGISLPNGFDTNRNPNSVTSWTRLSRADSDDVLREFDPVSRRHTLRASFMTR